MLTFSLPTAPGGMTIDPASGLIRWTPDLSQQGAHDVVVKVEDTQGLFALQGYSLQVGEPVAVPAVTGLAQATAEGVHRVGSPCRRRNQLSEQPDGGCRVGAAAESGGGNAGRARVAGQPDDLEWARSGRHRPRPRRTDAVRGAGRHPGRAVHPGRDHRPEQRRHTGRCRHGAGPGSRHDCGFRLAHHTRGVARAAARLARFRPRRIHRRSGRLQRYERRDSTPARSTSPATASTRTATAWIRSPATTRRRPRFSRARSISRRSPCPPTSSAR